MPVKTSISETVVGARCGAGRLKSRLRLLGWSLLLASVSFGCGDSDATMAPMDGGAQEARADGGGAQEAPIDDGGTQETPIDGGGTQATPIDSGVTQEPPIDGGGTQGTPIDSGEDTGAPPDADGGSELPVDACPDDPHKTEPGVCGCGRADADTDGDGVLDCLEGCPPGYDDVNGDGTRCDDIDECQLGKHNCDPLASCTNQPGGFTCGACPAGYDDVNGDGTRCNDIDECQLGSHTCDPLASCMNQPGGFACGGCPAGYDDVSGDGTRCDDIDECAASNLNDCDAHASCTNTSGSYTCTCAAGYVGSGTSCFPAAGCDPSKPTACHAAASCVEVEDQGHVCSCHPGYEGDGTRCEDIDECKLGKHNCDRLVSCTNQHGGFVCGACPAGYDDVNGDGTRCNDIDECKRGQHNCDPLVTCTNQHGGFVCGACPAGYDDVNRDGTRCEDVDECKLGQHDCDPLVACKNQPGGFACGACPAGYRDVNRDGTRCIDVDECKLGQHDCDPLVACTNQPGGFACGACPAGYRDVNRDGTRCDDIDECKLGQHNCDPLAQCANTQGGFSCACPQGTIDTHGDGTHCSADLCPGDPDKTEPGVCGCGVPDIDTDGDGSADCDDACLDEDGDGYGEGSACAAPDCNDDDPNHWADCGECDDADGDGRGQNCDLGPDCDDSASESWSDCETCAGSDYDEDGYGALCDTRRDCDDSDPSVHPGAPEIPDDSIDNDCEDGDAAQGDLDAIYLAAPETLCHLVSGAAPITDDNPGTASAPVATLTKALELAADSSYTRPIVAAAGTYFFSPAPNTPAPQVQGGALFGGYHYDCFSSWALSASEHSVIAPYDPSASMTLGVGPTPGWILHRVAVAGKLRALSSGYLVDVNFRHAEIVASAWYQNAGVVVLARSSIDFDVSGTRLEVTKGHLLMGANYLEQGDDARALYVPYGGSVLVVRGGASATLVENQLLGNAIGVSLSNEGVAGSPSSDPAHLVLKANLIAPKRRTFSSYQSSTGVRVVLPGSTATLKDNVIQPSEEATTTSLGLEVVHGVVHLDGDRIESGRGTDRAYAALLSGQAQVSARNVVFWASSDGSGLNETVGTRLEGGARLSAVNSVFHGGDGASSTGLQVLTVNGAHGAPEVLVAHGVILGGTGAERSAGVDAATHDDQGSLLFVNSFIQSGQGDWRAALVSTGVPITLVGNSIRQQGGGQPSTTCMIWDGVCRTTLAQVNACAWSGCEASAQNKSLTPSFIDPAGGNFRLQPTSALIDAGVDPEAYVPADFVTYDIDGQTRPQGRSYDIGIDEVGAPKTP